MGLLGVTSLITCSLSRTRQTVRRCRLISCSRARGLAAPPVLCDRRDRRQPTPHDVKTAVCPVTVSISFWTPNAVALTRLTTIHVDIHTSAVQIFGGCNDDLASSCRPSVNAYIHRTSLDEESTVRLSSGPGATSTPNPNHRTERHRTHSLLDANVSGLATPLGYLSAITLPIKPRVECRLLVCNLRDRHLHYGATVSSH